MQTASPRNEEPYPNHFVLIGADGKTHQLKPGCLVIGRSVGCDIMVDSSQVSRRHALLEFDGQSCVVYDEGSMTGTFIQSGSEPQATEHRVNEEGHPLQIGDRLRIGDAYFSLSASQPQSTTQPPAVQPQSRQSAGKQSVVQKDDSPSPTAPSPAPIHSKAVPASPYPTVSQHPGQSRPGHRPILSRIGLPALIGGGLFVLLIVAGVVFYLAFWDSRSRAEGVTAAVSVSTGTTVELDDGATLIIPPDAISKDTTLTARKLPLETQNLPSPEWAEMVGDVYEFKLEDAAITDRVGIVFPYDDAGLTLEQEENLVPLYFDGENWVKIDGIVDTKANQIRFTTSHFTLFTKAVAFVLDYDVTLEAKPQKYGDIQILDDFNEDLILTAYVQNPDKNLASVQIRYEVFTINSFLRLQAEQFTEMMMELGMLGAEFQAGLSIDLKDKVKKIYEINSKEETPWLRFPYVNMVKSEGETNTYHHALTLKSGNLDEIGFILPQNIRATVRATYRVGGIQEIQVEEVIDIPISTRDLAPQAILKSPGPTLEDVQGQTPTFEWNYRGDFSNSGRVKLLVARGDKLWDRFLGLGYVIEKDSADNQKDFNEFTTKYSDITEPLKPGRYSWGIIVSNNDKFGDADDTKSPVYHFMVQTGDQEQEVEVTQVETEDPTEIPSPTNTPTDRPPDTPTRTPTSSPTNTNTPINTPTKTRTPTPTDTPTSTPTKTPTPTPTVVKVVEQGRIDCGESVQEMIEEEQKHLWTFRGDSEDIATIVMYALDSDDSDLDPYLKLYDPRDDLLTEDDDSAGDYDALIRDYPLPRDGTYTIVVQSYGDDEAGPYELSLSCDKPTPTPTNTPQSKSSGNWERSDWDGKKWCGNSDRGSWLPDVSNGIAEMQTDDYCWGQIKTEDRWSPGITAEITFVPWLESGGSNKDGAYFGFGTKYANYDNTDAAGLLLEEGEVKAWSTSRNIIETIGSYRPGREVNIVLQWSSSGSLKISGDLGSYTLNDPVLSEPALYLVISNRDSSDGFDLYDVTITGNSAQQESPTPTPTGESLSCRTFPERGSPFYDLWRYNALAIGCPRSDIETIPTIAEEAFEGGHMFWRSDTDEMFIILDRRKNGGELNQGSWGTNSAWKWDGSDPDGIGLNPPSGRVEPKRGFGYVWREFLGREDGPLGWALDKEYGFDSVGIVQEYDHGFMFKGSSPKVYMLLDDSSFIAE